MTSKEALERLYDGYQYGMNGRSLYDIISQDLDRLEKLEKVIEILKSMFKIKIGNVSNGVWDEYFIAIKELDGHSSIAEIIPIEDIEIFKEVLK